ncbi:hypothetical protein DNTS_003800 [Danionella cerebrum]|uniref:non-specific serine/threonine protein kinase n=1 Tax=Danionella cerebrum TaxID=2873325 RepID=A0A553N431_9TELE|nr:hypothetical protein DNTS_003800 [Danionella translucida]
MEEVTQQPHCSHHEMPAVAAGERRGEEVLGGATKKKFWKLPSFLKRAKKQSPRDEAEEQELEQEQVPSWPHSNSEDDIMDHYELIKPLGAGGFGVVFEATRVADGLTVALKEVMKTKDLEYITINSFDETFCLDNYLCTMEYYPPEYSNEGRYHGEPAMVWALGVVMFALLCGRLPDLQDLVRTAENVWTSPGLSKKCCKLVCSLLQPDPERRMKLGEILAHAWFKQKKSRINPALFVPSDAPTSPLKRFRKLLACLKRKKHSPQEQAEEEEQEQVPVPPAPPSNSQDCNQEEAQRPTADAGEEASSTELQDDSIVCRALSFLLRPLQSLIDQFNGLEEMEPQPVGEEEEEGEEDEIEEAEEAVEEAEEGEIEQAEEAVEEAEEGEIEQAEEAVEEAEEAVEEGEEGEIEEAEEAVEEAEEGEIEEAAEDASSQGPPTRPKKRFLRLRAFIKNAKDRLSVTRRGEVSVTEEAHGSSEVSSSVVAVPQTEAVSEAPLDPETPLPNTEEQRPQTSGTVEEAEERNDEEGWWMMRQERNMFLSTRVSVTREISNC